MEEVKQKVEFTEEQQSVIDARDSNILVSAAAGALAYIVSTKLFAGINMYYLAGIQIVIYAIGYSLLAYVFSREMFGEVKYIIGMFLHKKR